MGKSFKRLAGAALNLRHDLIPTPDVQKYVRAFLTDKNGASVGAGTVDLTAVNFASFVDTAETMPSTDQLVAKFVVYEDSGYTVEDCEYPGDTDVYVLDNLLPTQLPGDPVLEAEVTTVELEAEITEGEIEAEIETGEIEAEVVSDQQEAEIESNEVEAEGNQAELEANKDC